jgi:hypothetical protein
MNTDSRRRTRAVNRAQHAGKTPIRLIVTGRGARPPSPRPVAGLRSVFRATESTCSDGFGRECAESLTALVIIRASHLGFDGVLSELRDLGRTKWDRSVIVRGFWDCWTIRVIALEPQADGRLVIDVEAAGFTAIGENRCVATWMVNRDPNRRETCNGPVPAADIPLLDGAPRLAVQA